MSPAQPPTGLLLPGEGGGFLGSVLVSLLAPIFAKCPPTSMAWLILASSEQTVEYCVQRPSGEEWLLDRPPTIRDLFPNVPGSS